MNLILKLFLFHLFQQGSLGSMNRGPPPPPATSRAAPAIPNRPGGGGAPPLPGGRPAGQALPAPLIPS